MYFLILIWFAIVAGIPYYFFGQNIVGIIGCVSASIGLAAWGAFYNAPKTSTRHQMATTFGHLCIFIAYTIGSLFTIAFGSISYHAVACLSQGACFYLGYVILIFVAENLIHERKQKKFYSTLKVGQLFEEQNSKEGLPWYNHNKSVELIRNTIWIIKELRHHNEIILQDVHFAHRIKKVAADELKEYTKLDRITWYRASESYHMIIRDIEKRASEEVYYNGAEYKSYVDGNI